jgi:MoxR-like ATPase
VTAPDWVKRFVSWGAGTRAVQNLVLGAKARAALHGHYFVGEEDVRAVVLPVLNHRVITNFAAQSEGMGASEVIRRLVEETPAKLA